jgi:inorganic pyrophosphatase
VPARVIGVLETRDRRGIDHKLLCVASGDPSLERVRNLTDLEPHWLREIETFFATYKNLELDDTEIVGWADAPAADAVVRAARAAATRTLA